MRLLASHVGIASASEAINRHRIPMILASHTVDCRAS